MAKASYIEGLTIEGDERPPRLTIDGRPVDGLSIDDQGLFVLSNNAGFRAKTLREVGEHLVGGSKGLSDRRRDLRAQHVTELKQGVQHWNKWRLDHPEVRPLLFDTDLRREATGLADLDGIDFANANLIASNLSGVQLINANFHEANLGGADLSRAILEGANFCRSDLYATNLSHAKLRGANLQGTQMAMTMLNDAQLIGCKIYGMSAWDVAVKGLDQGELVIVYRRDSSSAGADILSRQLDESTIIVDDIETAQFVYLILNNPKISRAVDSLTSKIVLILGRFTAERKAVLDKVREALRRLNYVPVLFDFRQPDSRNITDTVRLLAQMSLFVIADVTDPSSSPFELENVDKATNVPVQTIVLHPHDPFSMFWDLRNRNRDKFLVPFSYRDPQHLLESLEEKVVAPSLAASRALKQRIQETENERKTWKAERT
jgi:hypothetical protein